MRRPARHRSAQARPPARLAARLKALEDRVRRLEGLLEERRPAAPSLPREAPGAGAPRGAGRGRRHCPGCTLELPPGRRAATCVWCGFHFSALRRRRTRQR